MREQAQDLEHHLEPVSPVMPEASKGGDTSTTSPAMIETIAKLPSLRPEEQGTAKVLVPLHEETPATGRRKMERTNRNEGSGAETGGGHRSSRLRCRILVVLAGIALAGTASAETWRGLTVAPENRCSPYDKKADYPYPQSVEQEIVRELGAVYGPFTGTCFVSTRDTDIEHIVATSEAHDSGLCAASRATRKRFAQDLRNLTLASPRVNRHQKSGKDAGEWVPERNECWFAGRVLEVKRAYGLTVDRREAAVLERIFSRCYGTEMELIACTSASTGTREAGTSARAGDDALARYDDNRNGRITCKEARRHGIAPVPRSHPAYRYMRDGDGDGVVCE